MIEGNILKMLLNVSKYGRTSRLMHAIEPIEEFLSRMQAGFYRRASMNPTTNSLIKLAYCTQLTPKNKSQTVTSELQTFVRTHSAQEQGPGLP